MSAADDLLAFAQPVDDNDPKEVAREKLKVASQRIRDHADAIPDKDTLHEEQEDWLKEWNGRLVRGNFDRE